MIHVFLGPTLPLEEARRVLDANYLPPISQGDLLGLLPERPRIVGIIDGYFRQSLPVWHREILYAMACGVHVLGAASMGALRAAELAPYGMRGVGRIYEMYRDGVLAGDDEVAVLHAPAGEGYRPLSVPRVDVRATLRAAVDSGALPAASAEALAALAAAIPYPELDHDALLARARAASVAPAAELDALARFVARHAVGAKRLDALELLAEIGRLAASDPPPFEPPFEFETTQTWRYMSVYDANHRAAAGEVRLGSDLVERLRTRPDLVDRAERRWLRDQLSRHLGYDPGPDDLARAEARLRDERGLADAASLEAWKRRQRLTEPEYRRLLDTLARERMVHETVYGHISPALIDELRLQGLLADWIDEDPPAP